MGGSSFGHAFRLTSFGESHGPAIGGVVDGCPPGIPVDEAALQPWLDRRRPGTSRFVTQRQEPDRIELLSGIYDGRTTGTPIGFVIRNVDQRSKDYAAIADAFRPGHADFAYQAKYGLRDPRGGGRSSARETAVRVAGGAIARLVLGDAVTIRACVVQIGRRAIDRAAFAWDDVARNPFFGPDAATAALWEADLDAARKAGSSLGAVLEVVAEGVPPGWGEPVYDRLDADIAKALMSINAVKGVEIGAGFGAAELRGEENGDEMRAGPDGQPLFLSNHAGGILGGISTGQPIVARFAVKPTSSILTPRRTVDVEGRESEIQTKGRHDPCVGIRAAPVAEAMLALVLADHKLRQQMVRGS